MFNWLFSGLVKSVTCIVRWAEKLGFKAMGRVIFVVSLLFCDFNKLRKKDHNYIHPLQQKFFWMVVMGLSKVPYTEKRKKTQQKKKIGIYLQTMNSDPVAGGLLSTLDEDDSVDIYIYDMAFCGKYLNKEKFPNLAFRTYDINGKENYFNGREIGDNKEYWQVVDKIIQDINADCIDCLFIAKPTSREVFDLVQGINTPLIGNMCFGSMINIHPKIDINFFIQPQVGFYEKLGKVYYHRIKDWYSDCRIVSDTFYYLPRVDTNLRRLFSERGKYFAYSGRISKLNNLDMLILIEKLLVANPELQFLFVGRDEFGGLKDIKNYFRKRGLDNRVIYQGYFRLMQNDSEEADVLNYNEFLKNAIFTINPYPFGGGSTIIESYLAGTPCVCMGLIDDNNKEIYPSYSWVDIPAIRGVLNSAYSPDEYLNLCQKCIDDEKFWKELVNEQDCIAERFTDVLIYWNKIKIAFEE